MSNGEGRLIAGRYRLGPAIGRGGMGIVWRARDEILHRDVAVKEIKLPPGLEDHERAVLCERTMREARSAARVRHEAIVDIYDVVSEDDRPWIVMELVDSRNLEQVVKDQGPLPPGRVAEIGRNLLAALGAEHAAGVLHRDVTVTFNRAVKDRARAERVLRVRSVKPSTGAWKWISSAQAVFRTARYWQPNQEVSVTVPGRTHRFTIGDEHLVKVDTRRRQLVAYTAGKLVQRMPITAGRGDSPEWTTISGIHLVMGRARSTTFSSPGLKRGERAGTRSG